MRCVVQVEGASKGSYGLNVARLAGLPSHLLDIAEERAAWMEQHQNQQMRDLHRCSTDPSKQ